MRGAARSAVMAAVFAAAGLAATAPARACSCAGGGAPPPVVFEGVAAERLPPQTLGARYAFDVERIERGEVEPRQVVHIDAEEPGSASRSSCSIGPAPELGGLYRVSAYDGQLGEERQLFVNLCGGELIKLSAASAPSPSVAAPTPVPDTDGESAAGPALAGIGLLALGLLALRWRQAAATG